MESPVVDNYKNKVCVDSPGLRRSRRAAVSAQFECNYCSESFMLKCNLIAHEVVHRSKKHQPKNSNCKTKLLAFPELNYHNCSTKESEVVEKPFQCSVCDRKFAKKSYLNRHQIAHRKESLWCCNHCDDFYECEDDLFIHQRIHEWIDLVVPVKCKKSKLIFQSSEVAKEVIPPERGENKSHTEISNNHSTPCIEQSLNEWRRNSTDSTAKVDEQQSSIVLLLEDIEQKIKDWSASDDSTDDGKKKSRDDDRHQNKQVIRNSPDEITKGIEMIDIANKTKKSMPVPIEMDKDFESDSRVNSNADESNQPTNCIADQYGPVESNNKAKETTMPNITHTVTAVIEYTNRDTIETVNEANSKNKITDGIEPKTNSSIDMETGLNAEEEVVPNTLVSNQPSTIGTTETNFPVGSKNGAKETATPSFIQKVNQSTQLDSIEKDNDASVGNDDEKEPKKMTTVDMETVLKASTNIESNTVELNQLSAKEDLDFSINRVSKEITPVLVTVNGKNKSLGYLNKNGTPKTPIDSNKEDLSSGYWTYTFDIIDRGMNSISISQKTVNHIAIQTETENPATCEGLNDDKEVNSMKSDKEVNSEKKSYSKSKAESKKEIPKTPKTPRTPRTPKTPQNVPIDSARKLRSSSRKTPIYNCDGCDAMSPSILLLERHKIMYHTNERKTNSSTRERRAQKEPTPPIESTPIKSKNERISMELTKTPTVPKLRLIRAVKLTDSWIVDKVNE